jgi:hypothetical protein
VQPPAAPGPEPVGVPAINDPGAYRISKQNLFVDVRASTATRAGAGTYYEVAPKSGVSAPSAAYELGTIGPSHGYVEQAAQWAWANPGGDWVNRDGVAQSTSSPHFTFAANAVGSGASTYTTTITAGVQAALARGRWNAYIVKVVGSQRAIAAPRNTALPASKVDVVYEDGTRATLACTACVQLLPGTSYTRIGASTDVAINTAVALEFEMPAKPVASATLTVSVTQHSGGSATINGYLANPPVNSNGVIAGVAANYAGDAGLRSDPSILFAQRYEDGTTLRDYVIQDFSAIDVWNLSYWDPELFGTGPANLAKLPTAHNGVPIAGTHKWFYKQNTGGTISLVPSTYAGDGFEPSAPGLGALRIVIPKETAADGGSVGYGGSTGSDLWALFPKAISGLIDETFVRFRVRFAVTPKLLAETRMFRSEAASTATYAIREGKWGVGTHHWTFFGGNNNVGGDNIGHSNRLGFRVHPADAGLMGIESYVHSWDMIKYNMPFGQAGGLGAGFYPNRWYWVEIRKKLNTYNASGAVGTSPADGLMEIYIDGRLAARHTNWKYRDGRIDYSGETPLSMGKLAPFRQMGDMGLLLNLYNGGVKGADEDTVMFFAQVACGTRYIGLPK